MRLHGDEEPRHRGIRRSLGHGFVDRIDRSDIRMTQLGSRPGLTVESGTIFLRCQQAGRQNFDRDVPVKRRIPGPVNDSHPPSPELGFNEIVGQVFTDHVLSFRLIGG